MTAAMGPFQRSHLNNHPSQLHPYPQQRKQHGRPQREREEEERQHNGSVIFTQLFSAPLVERKRAQGGSGCILVEKVDELSYQKERDTLHSTLDNAGKRVRFLSEAANTRSFARAVGCRSPPPSGRKSTGSSTSSSSAIGDVGTSINVGGGGGCRDGECRIVHFTGHGVPGQLTFEDDSGQLQYVDEEELLSMLLCGRPRPSSGGNSSRGGQGGGGHAARRGPGRGDWLRSFQGRFGLRGAGC